MEQKRRTSPSSDSVLELARSYQGAAVLCAAAELDVFSRLTGNGSTASVLAADLGCSPRGMLCLLNALVALDLLDKEGARFNLKTGLGNLLTSEGPASVLMMLRHQANCMRRWSQLAMSVKRGSPAPCLESVGGPQGDLESFIGAMDNVSAPVASEVVKSLNTIEFSQLLDIGGASGTWTIAMLAMKPSAKATLFDLPEVLPLARSRLTAAGLAGRVELAPGNFYTDELPHGADLAWVSAIIHQNSREQNVDLFRKVHKALATGGFIAIRDLVMEDDRTEPVAGALFAINMLVATPAGGTFTFAEIQADLQTSGFTEVEVVRADEGMNSVVKARKKD